MRTAPSKYSSSNHDAPKGSVFRTVIFVLLGGMAAAGMGGYLLGSLSESKRNKADIFGPADVDLESDGNKNSKNSLLVDRNRQELCRLIYSKTLNDDEIMKLAEEVKKKQRNSSAEGIIKEYCIRNNSDSERIKSLISEGYKFGDIGKNGLLFFFSLGFCKLKDTVYLLMFGSMFKKRLADAVL